MRNCREIGEQISAYIDDRLEPKLRLEMDEHLKSCNACREELDDILFISRLCRTIPDVELPRNFRLELHDKLVKEKEKIEGAKKVSFLKNKYIQIGSTIAAGLAIIILLKGFTNNGLLSGQSAARQEKFATADSVAGAGPNKLMAAQKAEAPAPAAPSDVAAGAAAGTAAAGATSDTMAAAGASGAAAGAAGAPAAITAPQAQGQGQGQGGAQSAAAPKAEMARASQDRAFAMAPADPAKEKTAAEGIKTADIAIISEYTADKAARLKEYALANSAADIDESSGTATFGAMAKSAATRELDFKIPAPNYNAFLDTLKENFGEGLVKIGETKTTDISAILEGLNRNLSDIDARIKELESKDDKSSEEELNNLKKGREAILSQMESLQLNSDYIYVKVTLGQ